MKREPTQRELPFTKVPNIFFQHWVNNLGLVEIRVVAAIIYRTFGDRFWDAGGWRSREKTSPMSVVELSAIVKRSKPLVMKALANLKGYGIVAGSRISRQEAYAYGLIMRPEFNALKEVPPPEKQKALPYDVHDFSSKETFTTEGVSVVKKPLPLSGKETFTTEALVLIRDPEIRSTETHTQSKISAPVENIAAKRRVCGSKFSKRQIRDYAWASHNFDQFLVEYYSARNQPKRASVGIQNPEGWATSASRSGEHDDAIQEFIDRPEMFDPEAWMRANRRASV